MIIFCRLLEVYILILFLRAILSWFPQPSGQMATFYRILLDLTEPVLAPLRSVIPAAGSFDLSFLVLFVFLTIVHARVC